MGGRMRRVGIAVAALSLLVVAGAASAGFADDGNVTRATYDSGWQGLDEEIHPVGPGTTYQSSWVGLDEEVHPGTKFDSGWQGLDEEIHPVAPGAAQADSTEPVPASGGTNDIPVFALAVGLGLAALIVVMATVYRKRTRFAHAR
jgi:hypothetical protein